MNKSIPIAETINIVSDTIVGVYTPWFPFKQCDASYSITDFNHSFKGLEITLEQRESYKNIVLKVYFFGRKVISNVVNESYRGKFNVQSPELLKDVGSCGPLFKVENSDYMRYLEEQSGGIMALMDFKHYFILDTEVSIDVASQWQPRIELYEDTILIEELDEVYHFSSPQLS
jgi:hypothetical protein